MQYILYQFSKSINKSKSINVIYTYIKHYFIYKIRKIVKHKSNFASKIWLAGMVIWQHMCLT